MPNGLRQCLPVVVMSKMRCETLLRTQQDAGNRLSKTRSDAVAGLITSAGIVAGRLVISLDDGSIIDVGVAQGPAGLRGPDGPPGPRGRDGIDGNTILNTQGRPSPSVGSEGDFVIDTVNWEIYGPKASDNAAWGKGQPLLASRSNPSGAVTHADRWKAGGGRFFPMGGTSASVAPPAATGDGLEAIIGNGQPLGANTWSPTAVDADGDLMEVTFYFSRAGGNEVYVCKVVVFRANTIGDLTVAWEAASPDTLTYNVEFDAPVVGSELTLRVRSDVAWEEIRGKIIKL